MPTFLALPPEQGGTTFGPFGDGTITVGTDPERCQLVLNPDVNLVGVHVWISPTGRSWTVQPATRGAAVFLRRGVSVTAVTVPVAAFPGDAVVLGRHDGVQFVLRGDPSAPVSPPAPVAVAGAGSGSTAPPSKAPSSGRRAPPTSGQMADEVKRQAGVAAHTSGPLAFLNQLFFRGRSGALLQPRYILAAVLGLGMAAVSGCAGLLGMIQLL